MTITILSRKELVIKHQRRKAIKLTPRSLISEQNMAEKTIDKHFNCCICLEIVIKPMKCQKCETSFCGPCASLQQEKSDSCPHCRLEPFTLEQLNRYELDSLYSTHFSCPRCDSDVSYGEESSHLGKCWAEIETCPACDERGLSSVDAL
jgi:hypothetical protein